MAIATFCFATLSALMISDQANQPDTIHRPNGRHFTMRFEHADS